ncbi:hypothetical protein DASC09_036840 [Saccharomycopsis crataegensis]|uniref:CID domain-containing protein n=1 Tax=Saccharomycopsis crataegensis TaxID=43959 RepID=A0AAV5QPI3_9ASCO|nr:hypothetical protein DASC09_036840 [Saccharomycopsis crataegensis]
MDPFEARLQFSRMLSTVQPVTQSLMKCVSFALRNHEYQDDFHSCIIEVLNTVDLNVRLNIMNFIDSLVTQSKKSFAKNPSLNKDLPYINKIEKDLPTFASKIVPANKYGLYNLKVSAEILKSISLQLGFDEQKIEELQRQFNSDLLSENLKGKIEKNVSENLSKSDHLDTEFFKPTDSEVIGEGIERAWEILIDRKRFSQLSSLTSYFIDKSEMVLHASEKKDKVNNNEENNREKDSTQMSLELSREQILARMESDRERHKKAKESLWLVERASSGKVDRAEFERLWDQYAPITDEDIEELSELNEIAIRSYNF